MGLLAYIIVSKFADHLPLYCQDGIFEREGVDIPRGTQSSWIMQTYEAIRPLEAVLKAAPSPSEPLRKAVDYALNQEHALRCYLWTAASGPIAIPPKMPSGRWPWAARTGCSQARNAAGAPRRSSWA